jgi:hypothetical protein
MNLHDRIHLLVRLGEYMTGEAPEWLEAKHRAGIVNGWFTPEFVDLSCRNIAGSWLKQEVLEAFADKYRLPPQAPSPQTIGLMMAGNIPLVGFHDFLCVFLSGHKMVIKPSSKDSVLIKHLTDRLSGWEPAVEEAVAYAELLKGCNAYIATGSNNSARYFDYYFRQYPHIIRRNRTSVAFLTGKETAGELERLSDDVHLYFGMGCRNVTRLYVPDGYDFIPLLEAFKKYNYFFDFPKYKNNYDYQLAIHLLNKKQYMSTGSLLLSEDSSFFSPISQVNYSFYDDADTALGEIAAFHDLQCLVSEISFGQAQQPSLTDYADGVDTMEFLRGI